MRKLFYLFAITLFTSLTFAQTTPVSTIKFKETEFDFGNNIQGKPITHEFFFTNTGTEPIILENVKASCGCTTPEWSKEPVMPGKTGSVKAQYNMSREGSFRKSITVTTKSGENVVLYIIGNAIPQTDGVDAADQSIIGGGK